MMVKPIIAMSIMNCPLPIFSCCTSKRVNSLHKTLQDHWESFLRQFASTAHFSVSLERLLAHDYLGHNCYYLTARP